MDWLENVRDRIEKEVEKFKGELDKYKPKELEDVLDDFEKEIEALKDKVEKYKRKQKETELEIEEKKRQKKLAIKRLKQMKK